MTHDTAEFAVHTTRRWWQEMGHMAYPTAGERLITADGGGSNGSRVRLWKVMLQQLAEELGPFVPLHHGQLAWAAIGRPGGL